MLLCNNLAEYQYGRARRSTMGWGRFTHIAARHWEIRWEEKEDGGDNHVYDAELL